MPVTAACSRGAGADRCLVFCNVSFQSISVYITVGLLWRVESCWGVFLNCFGGLLRSCLIAFNVHMCQTNSTFTLQAQLGRADSLIYCPWEKIMEGLSCFTFTCFRHQSNDWRNMVALKVDALTNSNEIHRWFVGLHEILIATLQHHGWKLGTSSKHVNINTDMRFSALQTPLMTYQQYPRIVA